MAKIRALVLLLIISISYANAQEATEVQDNTRVSVYIHPLSLSSNIFFYIINAIYSTIEIPIGLSNSLIVKPSLLRENTDLVLFKLGSDIGMRHYLFGKGEGLYLQEQIGIFYYSCDDVSEGDTFFSVLPHPARIRDLWLDAMGYLGYSLKFSKVSVFADIGFGVATGLKSVIDPKRFYLFPLPDFNLGIGFPF
jgi:hypothetical protein